MNSKRRSVWAFVITSVALFMASLDNPATTVTTRDAHSAGALAHPSTRA